MIINQKTLHKSLDHLRELVGATITPQVNSIKQPLKPELFNIDQLERHARAIAGAGLDVFEKEPLPMDSPFLEMHNVVLTPHIAFQSEESLDECTYVSIENVEMFVKGKPQNVVNPSVLANRRGLDNR